MVVSLVGWQRRFDENDQQDELVVLAPGQE